MRPQELIQLLRTQPFIPLKIFLSDGKIYEIRHPEQMIVQRSRVDIGMSPLQQDKIERTDYVSLLHIVRTEQVVEVYRGTASEQN